MYLPYGRVFDFVRVCAAVDSSIQSKLLLASRKLCMSGAEERGETLHMKDNKRHIPADRNNKVLEENMRTEH